MVVSFSACAKSAFLLCEKAGVFCSNRDVFPTVSDEFGAAMVAILAILTTVALHVKRDVVKIPDLFNGMVRRWCSSGGHRRLDRNVEVRV